MKRIALMLAALALTACGPATTSAVDETSTTVASDDASLPPGAPCAAGQHEVGATTQYSCSDSVTFSVAFEEDTGCAVVDAGGQSYRLGSAISGSGARYSDGATQFWEHQGEATLEGAAGGPYTECKAPAEE